MSSTKVTVAVLEEQNVAMLKMLNRANTIINKQKTLMPNMDWMMDFDKLKEKIGNTYEPNNDDE